MPNKNPIIISNNGVSISSLIVGPQALKYLKVGKVFHQSTENLIIGRLIAPKTANKDVGFEPSVTPQMH